MVDYQQAYLKEKQLRKRAEQQLEDRSRELYESYQQLQAAHDDLQRQQTLLVSSEKMASLGIMSAGVAHEINNPLGFVSANFNAISRAYAAFQQFFERLQQIQQRDGDIRQAIAQALQEYDIPYLLDDFDDLSQETTEGLNRVKQIVADLKAFVRDDSGEPGLVDINDCLRGALNILSNQIKYHARLEVEYGDLPEVKGFAGKLGQVFTNLIANASQAVDENGLIRITTECRDNEILIRISDNGCGMPEEVIAQLFTPFFTTKPVGEGTGLGLSISYGIIEEHGGRLLVDSTPGEGSCFQVVLPLG